MSGVRSGEMVALATQGGRPFQAYVTGDEQAERGVLLFHEWWGLRDHNRNWADDLARQGYRCVALDLYDGRVTDNAEEASHWMAGLAQDATDDKIQMALRLLRRNGRSLGAVGYSMGGKQALRAALLEPESVQATVVGYCRMENDVEQLSRLHGPVLAIYAEQERSWPDKQKAFEEAMHKAGKHTESLSYDAAHGFINPGSERYNSQAAQHSWKAMLAFFDRYL